MHLLSAEHIHKMYGEKILLDDVSFGIDEDDRIGLIGVNGTGKSTFLKIIAGLEWPDAGKITPSSHVLVHYLPQNPEFEQTSSVLDQVFYGDRPVMKLLRDYQRVVDALASDPGDTRLQDKLIRMQSALDSMNAWALEHEAKIILTQLGIRDFEAVVGTLSGGQRKRVALARALITPCDLLVLDEPTNHIDNQMAAWLESYLQKRKGALLMVTHDRYFLDRVTNRIFELDYGHLYRYEGNYNTFLAGKVQREAQERASEEKRQNFLRNELEWISRGPRARGTKQKARTERYYDVLENTPESSKETLDLSTPASRLGNTVIELHQVTKGYHGPAVINNFSYILLRNDRIGIVGPNGSGKSTLLKLMAGKHMPDNGRVVIGSTVKIGYFAQEYEEMDGSQRVIEYIREVAEYVQTADGHTITAAQMLERFLFPGHLQWTPLAKLSGGERRRVALLRTLMEAPNVLLLDEPTNDLDIPTLAILESFIDDFQGAVVAVSHDRYFLDRIVDKIFAFEGQGNIIEHLGDFSSYLDAKVVEEVVSQKPLPSAIVIHATGDEKKPALKFTYQEQKEYDQIDGVIADAEQRLAIVTQKMQQAGGDYAKLQTLYDEQKALEAKLDLLLERWTYLNEFAEKIQNSKRDR